MCENVCVWETGVIEWGGEGLFSMVGLFLFFDLVPQVFSIICVDFCFP